MTESKRRVLVVEDEAVTALDLQDMLGELGYDCVGLADRGEQAISEATAKRPHLILMDIRLKGEMDGIDAANTIWKTLGIPIVFLTSYSDERNLGRAKLLRPYGYILKPFEQDELRTTLELAFYRLNDLPGTTTPTLEKTVPLDPSLSTIPGSPTSDFLHRVDPFRALPVEARQALAKDATFTELEAGKVFIAEGQEQRECFIVAAGRIACLKCSRDGKELIVHLLAPGDIFGVIIGLDEGLSPFSIRAERDSTILKIPIKTVASVLQRHPEMYQEFNELMTLRIRQSADFSRQLAHERVEVRIATALLMLVGEFAKHDSNNHTEVIDITRQELAQLSGTTPETAIRITKIMEGKEILDLSRPSRIVVKDIASLETIVQEIGGI